MVVGVTSPMSHLKQKHWYLAVLLNIAVVADSVPVQQTEAILYADWPRHIQLVSCKAMHHDTIRGFIGQAPVSDFPLAYQRTHRISLLFKGYMIVL